MSDVKAICSGLLDELQKIDDLSFNEHITTVPCGIDIFDTIMGGGIPIGRIVSVVGAPGGGKSSLLASVAAGFQKFNDKTLCVYMDAEQGVSYDRLESLGCKKDQTVLISQFLTVEKVYDIIEKTIAYKVAKKYHDVPYLFIWDSESATQLEKQQTENDLNKTIGLKARTLSYIIPKLANKMAKYNCTLIIIGQLKDKIDMNMYTASGGELRGLGDKTITGGNTMKFAPFQMIHLKPKSNIDKDVMRWDGVITTAKAIKNKLFTPLIQVNLVLNYKKGFSDFWTKEQFIRDNKGIKGTAWQYLENHPDKKFRKFEMEVLYNSDSEFKEKFEELYEKCKQEFFFADDPLTEYTKNGIGNGETDEPGEVEVSETDQETKNENVTDVSKFDGLDDI